MSKRKKPLVIREKRVYTPFPPAQTPRKVDLQIESGEYFLNEAQRETKKKAEKIAVAKEKTQEKREKRLKEFVAPEEPMESENLVSNTSDEGAKQKKKRKRNAEAVDEHVDDREDDALPKKKKSKKHSKREE